jgi:hypothetical protein
MFKELDAKIQQDLVALGKEIWAEFNIDVPEPVEVYISRVDQYLSRLHTRTPPEFEVTVDADGTFTVYTPMSKPVCPLTIVATRR